MGELLVELYDTVVGRLSGGRRDFDFTAEPAAVQRFGLDSSVLSVAIPLAPAVTRSRRVYRQAFFLNLLPEGQALTRLANRAGVEADDAVGFLRHYGRDVAGALQVWDPDLPGEPRAPRRFPLDEAGVAVLLRDAQGSRSAIGQLAERPRLRAFRRRSSSPRRLRHVRAHLRRCPCACRRAVRPNCERLARSRRRLCAGSGRYGQPEVSAVRRQGDACSRRRGAPPERSFLAGRACPDGRRRSGDMAHQPTDGELAMAVGREYRHASLTVEHLAQELGGWGVPRPEAAVGETVEAIRDIAQAEEPLDGANPGLRGDIVVLAERLLRGEPVGRPMSLPA